MGIDNNQKINLKDLRVMRRFLFLFCNSVSNSRWHLLQELIAESNKLSSNYCCYLFISGEALFEIYNSRWKNFVKFLSQQTKPSLILVFDGWEAKIRGINIDKSMSVQNSDSINQYFKNILIFQDSPLDFWHHLVKISFSQMEEESLSIDGKSQRGAFFQLEGPYMSRTSVYALRFLQAVLDYGKNPALYAYLDGLHLFHKRQHPSEFENIGESLIKITNQCRNAGLSEEILGCSRCAVARGYSSITPEGQFIPLNTIESAKIVNLNEIIERLNSIAPIYSPNSGFLLNSSRKSNQKESKFEKIRSLLIVISHSPYHSEWAFGGISLAVACANNGIETKVLFQDAGVLLFSEFLQMNILSSSHFPNSEYLFNLKDIIEVTCDMENLEYYIDGTSEKAKILSFNNLTESVSVLFDSNFGQLFQSMEEKCNSNRSNGVNRILFF